MVLAPHPNPDAPVLSHFNLSGKTALVTGGSRGIGLAVARALAEAGADVVITYSSTAKAEAEKTAAEVASSSSNGSRKPKVLAFKCDVRSRTNVEAVVEAVTAAAAAGDLGAGRTLDVVVANAGIGAVYPALVQPEDNFRELFDVNLNGAFWTAQAAGRVFERQLADARAGGAGGSGRGAIIFTASVSASLVNVPQNQAAYNATKAALVHLAKSLAVEWVDFARVNCVSPGYIETEILAIHPKERIEKWLSLIPAGRLCKASELKGAYVFLASDASSYMTGVDLLIDGGYTLP
ncbi:hypothetical protein F4779DRAFT_583046 [Xylariaceae sp. FL0662B]|nr:hypothetical protein F4779DRAFT_583046 [Xylariaceae sp. FL0662B]